MKRLFGGVYAAATLGILLREFTRWARPATARGTAPVHLLALTMRTGVLDGIDTLALVDIDSMLRPVYGHAEQGAAFGHTKIANRQVLRKGLSPPATTISSVESLHHFADLVDDGRPRPQLLLGDSEDLQLEVALTQLLVMSSIASSISSSEVATRLMPCPGGLPGKAFPVSLCC